MIGKVLHSLLIQTAVAAVVLGQSGAGSLGTIFKQPPPVTGPAPHFKANTPGTAVAGTVTATALLMADPFLTTTEATPGAMSSGICALI